MTLSEKILSLIQKGFEIKFYTGFDGTRFSLTRNSFTSYGEISKQEEQHIQIQKDELYSIYLDKIEFQWRKDY